jgi:hypothetical protein
MYHRVTPPLEGRSSKRPEKMISVEVAVVRSVKGKAWGKHRNETESERSKEMAKRNEARN